MLWILFSVIGWIGTTMIVIAFAKKQTLPLPTAAMLNIAGAGLLAVSLTYNRAWPGIALNVIWMVIAIKDWAAARRSTLPIG